MNMHCHKMNWLNHRLVGKDPCSLIMLQDLQPIPTVNIYLCRLKRIGILAAKILSTTKSPKLQTFTDEVFIYPNGEKPPVSFRLVNRGTIWKFITTTYLCHYKSKVSSCYLCCMPRKVSPYRYFLIYSNFMYVINIISLNY